MIKFAFIMLAGITLFVPAQANSRDILSDVLQIISGPNETVRKWRTKPTYAFVGDAEGLSLFHDVIGYINAEILTDETSIPGATAIQISEEDTRSLYTSETLDLAMVKPDGVYQASILTDDTEIRASTLVFYAPGPDIKRIIKKMMPASPEAQRYSERSGYCHFEIYSKPDGIAASLIFINSSFGVFDQASCMYEEIMQSFGLVDDADGTPYFTFDDLAEPEHRRNDRILLKTLYAKDVKSGDPAEKVAQMVLRNLKLSK